MNIKTLACASLSVLFAVGCTTFSREECLKMDWSKQGEKIAIRGETRAWGQKHFQRTCQKEHGVVPNFLAYEDGYAKGLKIFCTPEFSEQFAIEGGEYQGTCPTEVEEKVVSKYRSGRIAYLENRIASLESENSTLESENSALKSEVRSQSDQVCP